MFRLLRTLCMVVTLMTSAPIFLPSTAHAEDGQKGAGKSPKAESSKAESSKKPPPRKPALSMEQRREQAEQKFVLDCVDAYGWERADCEEYIYRIEPFSDQEIRSGRATAKVRSKKLRREADRAAKEVFREHPKDWHGSGTATVDD